MDSASEAHFITLAACKKLGIRLNNVCESVSGVGSMDCSIRHSFDVQIKSRTSEFKLNMHCLIVPQQSVTGPNLFGALFADLT